MRKFITLFILMSAGLLANSQSPVVLSIDEAIELALNNNYTLKMSDAKQDMAKADYQQSAAAILPSVEFSMSGLKTNDPLSAFGFKLKQEIVTQADFAPALLNDPLSMNHFSMKLQLNLPIINMDGIYQRRAAKLGVEASKLQLKRTTSYIQFQVKQSYYEADLSEKVIAVVKESLASAKEVLVFTQNNYEQGLLKEADVLLAKVNVSDLENKLLEAHNSHITSQGKLAQLIGADLNTTFKLNSDLKKQQSFTHLDQIALAKRSDIQAYQKGIDAQKELMNAQQMKFIPRINAFGTTEWNDASFLGTKAHNYTLGAMLSWKLFNGQKNIGAHKKAKASYNHSKEAFSEYVSQNELELAKAKRNLSLYFNRIKTAGLNYSYAKESQRILKDRYKQGLEKTIDLLYAENLASNRKLAYLQSQYQYQIQQHYVELLIEKELTH
jgi:outer membrane protein TolC